MKRLIFCLLLAGCAATANAYHGEQNESTTANANASCNAAFHSSCPADQTFTASSSGFAAPAGDLGSTFLETALMVLLIGIAISSKFCHSMLKHESFRNKAQ